VKRPGIGESARDVTFTASDGVTLSAWYVAPRNGAAVVLLHGAGSTRTAVLDAAAVLARHGYGALLVDARGHGRSGGRAMDFGWYGDADVAGAVAFLLHQGEVDASRIAVLGLSMGGEEAIGAAATIPAIAAVIAEGATTRSAADKSWLPAVHGVAGLLQRGLDAITYGVTDVLTAARPPITLRRAVAATAPRRVLLIAAGAVDDEIAAGRHIQGGSPTSVELWIVPGASHTAGLRVAPAEWERRVIAFLDDSLAIDTR
jgi:uncharacterized protein